MTLSTEAPQLSSDYSRWRQANMRLKRAVGWEELRSLAGAPFFLPLDRLAAAGVAPAA